MTEKTIILRGALDFSALTQLRAAFASATNLETIDMSGVTMMTSASLIEFVSLAKRMGRRRIVLLNAQPAIRRLFHILGMNEMFLFSGDTQAGP